MCQIHKLAHRLRERICATQMEKLTVLSSFITLICSFWALKAELHNFLQKEKTVDRSCWSKHIWHARVCLHFHICLSRQLDLSHTWHYVKGTARWCQQHGGLFQSPAPETGDRSTGPMTASCSCWSVPSKNTLKTEYWLSRMSSSMNYVCCSR